jgi:hypothetical protein
VWELYDSSCWLGCEKSVIEAAGQACEIHDGSSWVGGGKYVIVAAGQAVGTL